jgi:hypothetical protein
MKASDIRRGYKSVEEDRIRRAFHQHEAQKNNLLKNKVLPWDGIFGFVSGWTLMSLLNNLSKDRQR